LTYLLTDLLTYIVADWSRQGANECQRCRHFVSDGACVARCPTMKYSDNSSTCRPCHAHCHPAVGCTGPGNGVGRGRCIDCALVKLAADSTVLECLSPETEECEAGYYRRTRTSSSNRLRNFGTMVIALRLVLIPRFVIQTYLHMIHYAVSHCQNKTPHE